MNKAIFKNIWLLAILCITIISFLLPFPMTSYGDDSCDYTINVGVAPNIINITSQGEGHAVVVHTNQWYDGVNRGETQIFVNDGGDNGDCPIEDFGQRKDDLGFLEIYFLLEDLKYCADDLEINSEFNIFRIEGVRLNGSTFCGESDMHIVGKQGPGK